ncbi:hypothetical protein [Ferrovibrio sp.]|uniref:hypothetical protein n=1 Tax=Ferrovibrio sp. TaxID=1917215 RepID=UPI0025BFC02C|nr:hypothetical protein [Ferrovibrio sp.]MBX3453588.1 hypothetical protein [Ferrovibrio sp.]
MHTVYMVLGGLAALAAGLLLGRAFGGMAVLPLVAKVFIALWLVVALANMWVGVSHAGYTVMQELPFLVVVFGVPAAVAAFVWWKLS